MITTIKNWRECKIDYLVLFILNATEMVLELVASRLMSPYFGNSNFVWTAIIGIILLAGSLGNIIGGKMASRKHPRFVTGWLLLFASIYIAATPLIDVPILQSIKDGNMGTQFSSVVGSIIFFLIPSTILGIFTPIVMKERIGDRKDDGKESGRITAIIAIGSLVGTFIGGFWLIPALGTKMIFVLLSIVIMLTALLIKPWQNVKNFRFLASFWVIFTIALITSFTALVVVGNLDSDDDLNGTVSIDTEYGRIIVEQGKYGGEDVIYYKQSGAYSSAAFVDEDKKYELVFNYLKKYDEMFKFLDVRETAMIGGAAYQYPKYFISHFPDKCMDVIEIDPKSTEIAKKYFYLDDLIQEYGDDRLGLYNEDGRVFMANGEKKYDAILNDAFSGEVPVATLATREAVESIKNRLNPGGVYMSNVLGAVSGDRGKFLRSEIKTLRRVFKYVYVMPVFKGATANQYTNWMVIATDNTYEPSDVVDIEIADNDLVLTDDYNPIDSLILTEYHD